MSELEAEIRYKVGQWVEYADEDLRMARHGLVLGAEAPYRLIAYHAQQCAEKYLKAYLVFRGIDFPFTHNILRLLELCAAEWVATIRHAEVLTTYAVTTRYPGEDEQVTEQEARAAIITATEVRQTVREALVQAGVMLPDAPG